VIHFGGKSHFTAAELAELALPGLARTKRKINERAAAECWALATDSAGVPLARPRTGRGGGLEYSVELLPAAARAALTAQAAVSTIADVTPAPETKAAQLWAWYDGANAKTKADATRRLAAIDAIDALVDSGMTRSAAVPAVAKRVGVGASTLWSWVSMIDGVLRCDRLVYLAPRRAGGGSETAVDNGAWQFLLSDFLRPEQPTFSACYERMKRDYATPRGITVPIERTLRRKLEREVDQRVIVLRREGTEALRRMLPAQERSVAELHALEMVNIDGHKFDVFVKWPDGRIGRPMMVAIQDIYSRKILAHRLDESENALATRLVFADLFRDWGIPRVCLMDNGRAFASKTITGGTKTRYRFKVRDDDPLGVLPAVGVEVRFATPYRGQSKPIERAFRDMCDAIAKHPAFAGAYTGNNPLAKPENYGSHAVPIEDFRRVVAAGIAAHNAKAGRRTEMARGVHSFDQVFADSYAVAPIGKATPEQLRMALLTAEDRTCDRETAVVTLEGNRYFHEALRRHAGKKLTVRFDPDDLHGEVHIYDRGGEHICSTTAIGTRGFSDKASANQRRAQEADHKRRTRELVKAQELLDASQIAALIPDYADEAPAPTPGVVRPVRTRGNTAAALKPAAAMPQSQSQTEAHSALDRMTKRVARLRLVP